MCVCVYSKGSMSKVLEILIAFGGAYYYYLMYIAPANSSNSASSVKRATTGQPLPPPPPPPPPPPSRTASATTRPAGSSPARITRANCLQEALRLLQNSDLEPRRDGKSFRSLVDHAGGWAQVPSGCSVASGRGSWVVHWNERGGINQADGWTRVCHGLRFAAEGKPC